jgi:D-alanyl-D-alanine carboxypeptidase
MMWTALGLASFLASVSPAHAQLGSDRYSSIVVDAGSGAVLSGVNTDELRHPASLTKIMTAYMLFGALRDGRLSLDQPVLVSAHAAAQQPSKLWLQPGRFITVEQALLGLVTKSANDAAAALGELMGGDEGRFAQMMTLQARSLGMAQTTFRNASGLPDPDQVTTARDLTLLARHLVQDFPMYYHYFSAPGFLWHGRMIPNYDTMLQTYPGADGIKAGYIGASGHNLVTSAVRAGVRLVGVVLGTTSSAERDRQMTVLLDQGFERMDVLPPARAASTHLAWVVGTAHAAAMPRVAGPVLRAVSAATAWRHGLVRNRLAPLRVHHAATPWHRRRT